MNTLYFPLLSIIGVAAIIGVILATAIVIIRRPESEQYRQIWLKLIILLAIILIIISLGAFKHWGILPLIFFMANMAWRELLQLTEQKYGEIAFTFFLSLLGTLATLGGLGDTYFTISLGIIIATWIAIALPMLITRRPPSMHSILVTTFGMLLISFPLACLLALDNLSYGLFSFLVLLVMVNDGFSEGFGRFLGKTPLCPDISPNKTWEGAIGGLLSCLATSYALQFLVPQWQIWKVLLIAAGISLFALIGDLIFSSLKRDAGIKDFGKVLLVTGGILDKFDGLMFVTPIFYTVVFWI